MVANYLYILPAAVAIFWVIRIFLKKDVNKIQLFIIAGMLMALLTLFYREASALFMFPFFYLALRQKISEKGIVKWDWLLIFPSILFIPFADTVYFGIFFACQVIAITVWAVVGIKRYNRKMAEIYDASSEMSADDISHILTFVISTVIITTLATKIPDTMEYVFWVKMILALFLAVLQFYIGYYTWNVKDTSDIVAEIEESLESEALAAEPGDAENSDDELISAVIDSRMYLDPYLSLVSLAEKLHTNRTYLSNSIHSCRGQNFSDFINTLRIKHFISIAKEEGSGVNIKDAAMRSGYNNIQSFYRNFSEIMQMTPKNWISNNL